MATTVGLRLEPARPEDAAAVAGLRAAVAEDLSRRYGSGAWSWSASAKGVETQIRKSAVLVARSRGAVIATLRLATKRPWAIDPTYFTPVRRPLYLTDMAVQPKRQRRGVGRRCLEEARRVARELGGDAIRLDAYEDEAGAGPFYRKCDFDEVGRASYRGVRHIYFEALL